MERSSLYSTQAFLMSATLDFGGRVSIKTKMTTPLKCLPYRSLEPRKNLLGPWSFCLLDLDFMFIKLQEEIAPHYKKKINCFEDIGVQWATKLAYFATPFVPKMLLN